ncbi:hypothetical protein Tco_0790231 [Tanacetum coccineum]
MREEAGEISLLKESGGGVRRDATATDGFIDHYRDTFSVIYLIYAHSRGWSSKDDKDDDIDIEADDDDEEEEEYAAPADSVVVALLATDQSPSAKEIEPFETDDSSTYTSMVRCRGCQTSREEDGDDEDESSEDDEDDDEVNIEADDEEEEEHPAPANSAVVTLPAADQSPSADETEPFETDESTATPPPHPAYRVTARISILAPVPTPVWSDAEIPSPPLPPIPSPSLPVSPPLPISSPVPVLSPSPPASPIRPLGYRAAIIRLSAEAASTSHSLPVSPPIILSYTRPAAPSSGTPPLHLLSTDRREDRPEVTLPPRKRLGIALGPAYEVGESSSAAAARPAGGLRADYGFVATIDREIRCDLERDVGYGITDSWDEIVETLQGAPLLAGRLNMLFRDRRAHARTARLMETEARMSREAWGRSMDVSDLARAEVMSLHHRRQKQFTEALKLIKRLQTQMAEFERQQGPAKGPAQPELPEEAGSSS